jgi:hypothetical protein
MPAHFMYIWSMLQTIDVLCGLLVLFVVIWYIFPRFGILYQD